MLEARDICVGRSGAEILRGASIAVAPREVVAVIGPNGAGKSTLMHVLSGALTPQRGRLTLDGRAISAWPRRALARKRAVLPQAPALTFPFGVLDVVLLGRTPYFGMSSRAEDLRIAEAAMRETGVLSLAARAYTTLSGGERQRVQLARALAQIWPSPPNADLGSDARYLLLDEPTNNLDLAHQHGLLETARRLAERGLGVIAILHDPNLAAGVCDRLYVMRDGYVIASGVPQTVLTETLIEATFGVRVRVLAHPDHGRPYMLPH